ncbi:RtcB family protein [Fulvivirga sediminis]|uniref:3'-phosphate/5'-hydroxy nucleic acid ligase n=1 Tax=Fulvivirga sediminis TaxID=2803949 RepID=A0A937FB84_9BACT|nr:RtcB family protein [Fulvivirga sediminis]MBL3658771.1 RtcB family protein [Fulvivirga sediminis]
MGKIKLKGKDLRKINYSSNRSIALAIDVMAKHYKHSSKEEQLAILIDIKNNFQNYLDHEILALIASEFDDTDTFKERAEIELLRAHGDFAVFGRKHISSNAFQQMEMAMRLPVSKRGALMPDAHQGYGLPIGGVLATENTVIPYGVGLDIGCRMSLTLYDVDESYLKRHAYQFKMALKERTNFGTGGEISFQQEHAILDRPEFALTDLLRQLHGKAVKQLGTSGSGNHFVEFGMVELHDGDGLGLPPGKYLGLLAHSGSRGMGASIARYYTQIAREQCLLPRQAQHFAWLDLDTEAGQEYWLSMNLAGDYAQACHDQIHYNLAKQLGLKPIGRVENHHNFAWKEIHQGQELIVHRKGATPAAEGVLGIIPGSMTAAGYIVRGKGDPHSLDSASHGAGRKMSRKKARESITGSELRKILSREQVTLIGGGLDEAPIAYKDLSKVMESQQHLVDVIGQFEPRIVRMDKN